MRGHSLAFGIIWVLIADAKKLELDHTNAIASESIGVMPSDPMPYWHPECGGRVITGMVNLSLLSRSHLPRTQPYSLLALGDEEDDLGLEEWSSLHQDIEMEEMEEEPAMQDDLIEDSEGGRAWNHTHHFASLLESRALMSERDSGKRRRTTPYRRDFTWARCTLNKKDKFWKRVSEDTKQSSKPIAEEPSLTDIYEFGPSAAGWHMFDYAAEHAMEASRTEFHQWQLESSQLWSNAACGEGVTKEDGKACHLLGEKTLNVSTADVYAEPVIVDDCQLRRIWMLCHVKL